MKKLLVIIMITALFFSSCRGFERLYPERPGEDTNNIPGLAGIPTCSNSICHQRIGENYEMFKM